MKKIVLKITIVLALAIIISPYSIYAASITPIHDESNTQQSTTSTTSQVSDTVISGASLSDGVEYLVMYSASIGGNDTDAEMEATVTHGSTVIAKTISEGSSSGSLQAQRGSSLHGYHIITGDGVDDLSIEYRCLTASDTCYIKGKTLIAIPLTELTEDADYYQTTQNGDTDEVSNVGTDLENVANNLITLTKTIGTTGDHIILMSNELAPNSTSVSAECRFSVAGSARKLIGGFEAEAETNKEYRSCSYAEVVSLTAGSVTFEIDVASESGALTDARRGRIIVIDISAFDQVVDVNNTIRAESTTQDFSSTFISQAYTPNQSEYVVAIGNGFMDQDSDFRSVMMRLENATDGTAFSDFVSNDAPDYATDLFPMTAFGTESISSAKTYELQFGCETTCSGGAGIDEGSLIIWGLTTSASAPTVTTDAADTVTSSTANINGDITATGGENANERGFAWGTVSTLSGGDTATTSEFGDFGTGTFSTATSSLSAETTYYFRAFAANTVGTSTGTILNFTTSSAPSRKIRLRGLRLKGIRLR